MTKVRPTIPQNPQSYSMREVTLRQRYSKKGGGTRLVKSNDNARRGRSPGSEKRYRAWRKLHYSFEDNVGGKKLAAFPPTPKALLVGEEESPLRRNPNRRDGIKAALERGSL